jgi:hypothetical protein
VFATVALSKVLLAFLFVMSIFVLACSAIPGMAPAAKPPPITTLLTASEVEKATGKTGLIFTDKTDPNGSKRDHGLLTISTSDGKLFLTLQVSEPSVYQQVKERNFRSDQAGLGDEAYWAPSEKAAKTPRQISFVKGKWAVSLSDGASFASNALVPEDQLLQLARIIESRL